MECGGLPPLLKAGNGRIYHNGKPMAVSTVLRSEDGGSGTHQGGGIPWHVQ